MMATGSRDGFGVHTLAYYRRVYDLFTATGKAVLLQAEYQGPTAGSHYGICRRGARLVSLRRKLG